MDGNGNGPDEVVAVDFSLPSDKLDKAQVILSQTINFLQTRDSGMIPHRVYNHLIWLGREICNAMIAAGVGKCQGCDGPGIWTEAEEALAQVDDPEQHPGGLLGAAIEKMMEGRVEVVQVVEGEALES